MTTPTAALVEEAQSMTTDTLIEEAMGEMHRLGIDNLRAKGAIILLSEALRRAEAERDAQHEQVLRLTGELQQSRKESLERARTVLMLDEDFDEACALGFGLGCMLTNAQWRESDAVERAQRGLKLMQSCLQDEGRRVSELTATRDLLLTENARLQQQLSRPDPVVHETPVDGVVPCCGQKLHDLKDGARVNEGPLVNCDRMRLLSRVGEVSSANLLLTAENERLQQEHNAYCRKLANDGLTVASRLQGELDAVRAENDTLHYLLRGGQ